MTTIPQKELRNNVAEVLRRAEAGEEFTITVSGRPVAQLGAASNPPLCDRGQQIDQKLLPHLSPLGWEHINLTGGYIWRQHKLAEQGRFRPLRTLAES